jgi:plastocyanin
MIRRQRCAAQRHAAGGAGRGLGACARGGLVSFALALFATACSGSTGSSSSAPAPTTAPQAAAPSAAPDARTFAVAMTDAERFQPATLTVPSGATVTWNNTGSMTHTVTVDPSKASNQANASVPEGVQPFDSGDITGGQSYSYTFTTPGTYKYFCIPHEALGMVGTVTVTG